MNTKIYIKDWLIFKPYTKQAPTDQYYLALSNKVKQAIVAEKESLPLHMYLEKEEINYFICFLTSYFEDVISETNLWNSFVRLHKRMYNKVLPFYLLDEYYEGEINLQDIAFLIWYFLNTIQNEKLIAPYNDFIIQTAVVVMNIFDEEWEYAPENDLLKAFYHLDEKEEDYYKARNVIDNILFGSYLFYPDTKIRLFETESEILENSNYDEEKSVFLNENKDQSIHTFHTCLLSLKGKEWAAEVVGNKHPLNEEYLNMSPRINGFFLYKGQDQADVFIEHIASGKDFKLTKKSFDHADELTQKDTILYMGMVRWKREWWFSGIRLQYPFDPKQAEEEKNNPESKKIVEFLDPKEKETQEILEKQLKAFKEINNDSLIAFMPSEEIDPFFQKFIHHYNNSVLAENKKNNPESNATRNEFPKDKLNDIPEKFKDGLVFFNPKSGIEIAFELNSAFPLPNNPFFNETESENHIMELFISPDISTELAMYCIDNCRKDLPFLNTGIGALYLNDMDFLFRFWKNENYHTKPTITIV